MSSLIGIDLNGIRDTLIRCEGTDEREHVDLGVRGGLIRLQSDESRWLGGAQTESAPHGRGLGWGRIGGADNRIDIVKVLEAIREADPNDTIRQALTSALPDLVDNSDLAVFAVPDTPAHDEAFRDRYLGLLKRVDGLRPLLLWRSVAALLGWIDTAPPEACSGCNVAILSLMADGVHLSVLSLEEEESARARLLVPQRNEPGRLVGASFRGEALVEDAQRQLARASGLSTEVIKAAAMSPWRFAVGAKLLPELARLPTNRGWKKLQPPDYGCSRPDESDLGADVLEGLHTANVLLIEGPFAGNVAWRGSVVEALKARTRLPEQVALLDDKAVARGCLVAAARHRLGQPIYFDFLPQLRINAMVGEVPQFVDLIAPGSRCRGGQTFRAEAPDEYAVDKGATRLTLWLFKEDFKRGRRADVELPVKADRRYLLFVSVEQMPGQGFATVRISSPEFDALRQTPITLDWVRMEEIDQTREEILKELLSQSQTGLSWPDTDVKQGHPFLWLKEHPKGDLVAQLAAYCATPLMRYVQIDSDAWGLLNILRGRFSQHDTPAFLGRKLGLEITESGSFRALDSDGCVPRTMSDLKVPEGAREQLDLTLSKLEKDLGSLQHRFGQRIERKVLGDILGFASWCFWRCPPGIADVFLGTYCGEYSYDVHHILLREGVARVVSKPDQLTRYFKALEQRLSDTGRVTAAEYAGLARVLGTSEEAAVVLNDTLADRIVEVTVQMIAGENKKGVKKAYKKLFKTALLMLAALLRHRKARPAFLDPDQDSAAERLLSTLDTAEGRNLDFAAHSERLMARSQGATRTSHLAAARRLRSNAEIIAELRYFIHLEGRNPNILRRIDAIEED